MDGGGRGLRRVAKAVVGRDVACNQGRYDALIASARLAWFGVGGTQCSPVVSDDREVPGEMAWR